MDRKTIRWILGLLSIAIFMSNACALGGNLTVNDSESAPVSVNISAKIMVDISPATFSWGAPGANALYPGDIADNDSEVNNFYALQVENIGSRNISYVWFNASVPSETPFGRGSSDYTNSGNYITLSNSSSDAFYFINRLEFNVTTQLVYLTDPSGNMPPDASSYMYGRLHNASSEYFWFINDAAQTNDSTWIRIGKNPHSKTSIGSVDFNDSSQFDQIDLLHWENYAYADVDSGSLDGYCIAVSDDNRVYFSRWNKDAPFHLCSNVKYSWDKTVHGPLVPGDSFSMKIKAYIPYGIYEGASQAGTITVLVNQA